MDLAERLDAIRAANAAPMPTDTPSYTDAQAKDVFLGALEEGKTVPEAAKLAGRTGSWFRARRQPHARVYDVDFALAFEEIMGPDGPNRENLSLRAFTALVKACEDGNVRAAEKILAAYHGDFAWLRPQAASGDINIERFQLMLPNVSTETLLAMREEILKAQQAQLPPGA